MLPGWEIYKQHNIQSQTLQHNILNFLFVNMPAKFASITNEEWQQLPNGCDRDEVWG